VAVSENPKKMRPMSEFDPSRRALVYDELNDDVRVAARPAWRLL
jgi:hypothetical protein